MISPIGDKSAALSSPSLKLMSTEELAELLDVDPSTIRRWRTSLPMHGPPFIQISERVVKYATTDVQRWLSARRVMPEAA